MINNTNKGLNYINNTYELKLDKNGQIIWLDHQANGSIQTYHHDPETTPFQRFIMKTVSLFPIEWMM